MGKKEGKELGEVAVTLAFRAMKYAPSFHSNEDSCTEDCERDCNMECSICGCSMCGADKQPILYIICGFANTEDRIRGGDDFNVCDDCLKKSGGTVSPLSSLNLKTEGAA